MVLALATDADASLVSFVIGKPEEDAYSSPLSIPLSEFIPNLGIPKPQAWKGVIRLHQVTQDRRETRRSNLKRDEGKGPAKGLPEYRKEASNEP
jgi:hypothetical protein